MVEGQLMWRPQPLKIFVCLFTLIVGPMFYPPLWRNPVVSPRWQGTQIHLGHLLPSILLFSDAYWTHLTLPLLLSQLYSIHSLIWASSDGPKSSDRAIGPVSTTFNNTSWLTGPHNSPSKSFFLTPRKKRMILTSLSYLVFGFTSYSWSPSCRLVCFGYAPNASTSMACLALNFDDVPVSYVQQ